MKLLTIYHLTIPTNILHLKREGLIISLQSEEGIGWGEISPLPGRNPETLKEALSQLLALKEGFSGPFFNSVAFGLTSAAHPFSKPLSCPASLLFMGTPSQILAQLDNAPKDFTSAKLKIGELSVRQAIIITKKLKEMFHLRLDINKKWTQPELLEFCSHFKPTDFDYIEDPGFDISPFKKAYDEILCPSAHEIEIWKPTVKGIPICDPIQTKFSNCWDVDKKTLILGSSFESDLGLASIARLAHDLALPPHPLGLGTYHFLEETILNTPLVFSQGKIHISSLSPKSHMLKKIEEFSLTEVIKKGAHFIRRFFLEF